MCKIVDTPTSYKIIVHLQTSASIQPRTSLPKFLKLEGTWREGVLNRWVRGACDRAGADGEAAAIAWAQRLGPMLKESSPSAAR